jgi:phytanoyl-CoA hydroxylase
MSSTVDLSREQLEQYHEEGFLVLHNAISNDTLDRARRHMANIVDTLARTWHADGDLDDLFEDLPFEKRWAAVRQRVPAARPVTWRRVMVAPSIYALWHEPRLLRVARAILGDELWAHELFNGRPREPNDRLQTIQWHQDAFNCTEWSDFDRLDSAP